MNPRQYRLHAPAVPRVSNAVIPTPVVVTRLRSVEMDAGTGDVVARV